MLFRSLFSLVFWALLAQWGYQEVALISPESTKYIDKFVEQFTPPTHNEWESIATVIRENISNENGEREELIEDLREKFEETYENLLG